MNKLLLMVAGLSLATMAAGASIRVRVVCTDSGEAPCRRLEALAPRVAKTLGPEAVSGTVAIENDPVASCAEAASFAQAEQCLTAVLSDSGTGVAAAAANENLGAYVVLHVQSIVPETISGFAHFVVPGQSWRKTSFSLVPITRADRSAYAPGEVAREKLLLRGGIDQAAVDLGLLRVAAKPVVVRVDPQTTFEGTALIP